MKQSIKLRALGVVFGASLALSVTQPGSAALIVSDDFNSYTANTSLVGKNGGTNGTGVWTTAYGGNSSITVVSPATPLSYTGGTVSVQGGVNAVQISNLGTGVFEEAITRGFTGQNGDVYFSFLFRPLQTPDTGSGGDFAQFLLNDDNDANNAGSVGMTRNQSPINNPYFAGVRDDSTDTRTNSSVAATANTTVFLVGKFSNAAGDADHDRMELWINPINNIEGLNPVAATANRDSNNAALIAAFTARFAAIESSDIYRFDELRIGTTFESVVPLAVVIPEPATAALGLIGLTALAARRRRV